ncbi:MAG: hypothetical protein FWE94_05175 [Coriobacteriia bacterium]|nr:hypothetical protein [Coriobacteriia bacterium]
MPTYGWTGKTLRINLTTGKISVDDTIAKGYDEFVGGEGLGFKVLWDEVPVGTTAYDPKNVIVFGAGPFNGTGIPHSGRMSITTLLATDRYGLGGTGHGGGSWTSLLKLAGWDSVIVEGESDKPVWIFIDNENVEIRDASHLWGNGVYHTNQAIMEEVGQDCVSVCAIGQAGENLCGTSTWIIDRAGSGQNGAPMGAKKLKAIAVKGTGSVKVACSGIQLLSMIANHTALVGCGYGSMKPRLPQSWTQYWGGTWTNGTNVFWGGADAPIVTGECNPKDLNNYAYRGPGNRSGWNSSQRNMRWLVRAQNCIACPVGCRQALHVPELESTYGVGAMPCNECGGISTTRDYYGRTPPALSMFLGSVLNDDYGLGDDYHILTGDFCYYLDDLRADGLTVEPNPNYRGGSTSNPNSKSFMQEMLPAAEWNGMQSMLQARANGDGAFIDDLLRRIVFREGELGRVMGLGSYGWAKAWGMDGKLDMMLMQRDYGKAVAWNETTWFAPHHFEGQQVGTLLQGMYNRDPCMHEQTSFNEIAREVDKTIFAKVGLVNSEDAIDHSGELTEINEAKIRLTKRLSADGIMHNSLSLCNRGDASFYSPRKERGYIGDSTMDAKEYSLITGKSYNEQQFHDLGLRLFNMMRVDTIRRLGTKDMRAGHDRYPISSWRKDHPSWARWADSPDRFPAGCQRMDQDDLEKGLDMYYGAMGWDNKGVPKESELRRLGLDDQADELKKLGLFNV